MIRAAKLAVPVAFLLLAAVSAEGDSKSAVDELPRSGNKGGEGYSQQYHYNSYPAHEPYGQTYAGLSFDVSTGIFIALGAIIVLLALAAVCNHLLSKGSGYGDGHGAGGAGGGSYGSYRSLNLASLSEKVLNGIERMYEVYSKNQ